MSLVDEELLLSSTLALLINFADRAKNPSLGTARKVLNILQYDLFPSLPLFTLSNCTVDLTTPNAWGLHLSLMCHSLSWHSLI